MRDDATDVLLELSLDMQHGTWSGSDFEYDSNGNQTRDLSRGVADIEYNDLNLPARVEMVGGGTIEYLYTAAGTKLAEYVRDSDDNQLNRRDYVGLFEFNADSLRTISLASGYVSVADTTFHLYVHDHQGNVAGVYHTRSGALEQFTDYYPYGLPHAMTRLGDKSTNRRLYSAKELTTDYGLNAYDFAARWLTPAFPRFTTIDRFAEKYYPISPYAYCACDPINYVDPTGMEYTDAAKECAARLTVFATNTINDLSNQIENINKQLDSKKLSSKKIEKLKLEKANLENRSSDLSDMIQELKVLEQSTQVYDVVISDKYGDYMGTTRFNTKKNVVEMVIPDAFDLELVGHEFKHSYQFEIGAYSISRFIDGSPIYDKTDEIEAFKRSSSISGKDRSSYVNYPIYSKLRTDPMNVQTWIVNEEALNTPQILQRFADRLNCVFRWNNQTYVGKSF